MYGMVNNALREMTIARLGEQAWIQACDQAGLKDSFFLSLETYPDAITYSLVGYLSELFSQPAGEFLHLFGEYWVEYAQTTSYAPLLNSCTSLEETLTHLNAMHKRIGHTLSNLNAPSFTFEKQKNGGILLYQSNRVGLTPFVLGLISGLAKKHGENVALTLLESTDTSARILLEYANERS